MKMNYSRQAVVSQSKRKIIYRRFIRLPMSERDDL